MRIWSLLFQVGLKPGQDRPTVWNNLGLCQMEQEQGGGCRGLFFPEATKKQEVMGGKQ